MQSLGAATTADPALIMTKRQRKAEFNRLRRILNDLRLLPKDVQITHIACSVNLNGENVLVVTWRA